MKKWALITGATSGFGYEFVKLFAKDKYNLILVARNIKRLNEIKSEFHNIDVLIIQKDLTKPNAVLEIINELSSHDIKVSTLVNNAGFGLLGEFSGIDINKQLNMINLNISALTELTYYTINDMKTLGEGKILNVASTASFQPGPLMAVYFATKAYVLSFSEALVEELDDSNITITTLCPGPTKTNFAKEANAIDSKVFNKAMKANDVAKLGYLGLLKGKRVVITGTKNKIGAYLTKFFPRSISAKVVKSIWNK